MVARRSYLDFYFSGYSTMNSSCCCNNPYSASHLRHPRLWLLQARTSAIMCPIRLDTVAGTAGWIVWIAGFRSLETKRVRPQRWISIRFCGRARFDGVAGWMACLLCHSSKTKRCFTTSCSSGGLIQLPLYFSRKLVLRGMLLARRRFIVYQH